jgi:dinuclear metal center YbgI/SA1388 family protein
MAKIESILHFMEETFKVSEFPDYSHALNGLQVEGPEEIHRVVASVDASEAAIAGARDGGCDLLLVHHGLFWDGFGPISGPRFRKVAGLIQEKMALYALHLPLDAHPELGNCAGLCRSMGLEPAGTFGAYKGVDIGCWAEASHDRDEVKAMLEGAVGGGAVLIPGGPERVKRVGFLTGGGAGSLPEAASMGLDTLITGEAAHHNFHDAMELGVNLLLGGHYATETFGVKALAAVLAQEFSLEWNFLDLPTGM